MAEEQSRITTENGYEAPGRAAAEQGRGRAAEWLFRCRLLILLVLFILSVVFEFSGSSVAVWKGWIHSDTADTGDILGEGRAIRSDEWAVNTPFALSQYHSDFGYISEVVRGTDTDMFIVYGQPVKDIAAIFRPFHWGYLFLSPAKGLSFFWCGRFFALFAISMELALLLFGGKRMLSVSYAFLISFAPLIQWWFAINGLAEMLIYGQLAIFIFIKYMAAKDKHWLRIIYAALLGWLAAAYVLLFYPAWQIPFAYGFLAIFIGAVILNYKKGTFSPKDIASAGVFLVVFAAGLAMVYLHSKETIEAVMNTSYPGARFEVGGGQLAVTLSFPTNLWLTFKEIPDFLNVVYCSFFSMFPLGIIFSAAHMIKKKRPDPLIICLYAAILFMFVYCAVGFPAFLAKITLMSYSMSIRAVAVFHFCNMFLMFYTISKMERTEHTLPVLAFCAVAVCGIMYVQNYVMKEYWTKPMIFAAMAIIFVFCLTIWYALNKGSYVPFLIYCICVGVMTGGTVNPVHRGLDIIYESELYDSVSSIVEADSDALWVSENHVLSNFLIMAGAHTINSTNAYPDVDRWDDYDEEHDYYDIYNRYAYIRIAVSEEDNDEDVYELISPDVFQMNAAPSQLLDMGVKYVLSERDLDPYDTSSADFKEIYCENGIYIYELTAA